MIAYFRSSRRRTRWTLGVVATYALLVVAGPLAGATSVCAMMLHSSAAATTKTVAAAMPAGHHCHSEAATDAGGPPSAKDATPPAHDCCGTATDHAAPAESGGSGLTLSGSTHSGGIDCMSSGCSGCSVAAGAALPATLIAPARLPPPLFAHLGSSVARHDATPSRLLRPPIA